MAFSPPAIAQETDPRFYIGGGGGLFSENVACPANTVCDDNTTAFKVFAGSRFNDNFALEATYAIVGETSYVHPAIQEKRDYQTFSVAPLVHFPIRDGNSIFVKFGVHNWEFNLERTSSIGTVLVSRDGTDIFYGIGTQFEFSDNIGLSVEWERYDFTDDILGSGDGDSFSANLIYNF